MGDILRILLADDHPLLREGVVSALQAEPGWVVAATASRGDQAVELARSLRPDVALIDLSMPGGGGMRAVREIASSLPHTRIIVLTASDSGDQLLAAMRAGAHGYVLKGVSGLELRDIVRRVSRGENYAPPSLAGQLLVGLSRPKAARGPALTEREAQILDHLAQGLTNREIGERLRLAEKTVKHHVTQILDKLGVRSRTEAALLAQQRRGELR